MKILTLFLVCISISYYGYSQNNIKPAKEPFAKNSIFVEFMGNSIFYGINYDRILIDKEKWKFTGRLGFSYQYYRSHQYSRFIIPSEFTFLFGKTRHFFETGLGVTYDVYTAPKANNVIGGEVKHYGYIFSRFGYRYQRPQGGFFFKAGLNVAGPLTKYSRYAFYYSEFIWVYGGVGIGYTFKQKRKSK
jgi:hypothetical protein